MILSSASMSRDEFFAGLFILGCINGSAHGFCDPLVRYGGTTQYFKPLELASLFGSVVAGVALIHHDINPELYESKFNKRELFWNLLKFAEWLTFKIADVVISTNESYRDIAIARGGLRPENVIVRSGPDLGRVKARAPNRHGAAGAVFSLVTWESFSRWLRGSNG